MPLLTEEKKSQIISKLGYPFDCVNLFDVLATDLPIFVIEKIDFFLAEITRIDGAIISSFQNIQIKKVDEIEFFNSKDTNFLIAFEVDKMGFVNELSSLISIPKAYGYRHNVTYQ